MNNLLSEQFMFATGLENSSPMIPLPDGTWKRVDEFEKTDHYNQWEKDFQLVVEMGISFFRYGIPYYKVHTAPGQYDWSFTDLTFGRLKELNITPIVDLCHFGVPDWLGNFQNPDFPFHFAEYAKAFALRFPYIQYYTPINEIFVTAMFSGLYGWWNECLASDKTYITALKNCCKANVMAMQAIVEVQPDAIFIQSESSEFFHPANPDAIPVANSLNEKRFLSLDLVYGYPVSATMYEYLMENGMTKDEYHWFRNNQVNAHCVMGNDYYFTNEHVVYPDGTTRAAGEVFGYYVITHQYFSRYRLPIMHTETNHGMPESVEWLYKQWANVHQLKRDGVPIIGFTWYSLLHQIDWDSALRNDVGHVNTLGLYDLDRNIMPVGKAYKKLISQWQNVLKAESYGLKF